MSCSRKTRGLDTSVKKKLLMCLDAHGGFQSLSYNNRVLAAVCDANPDEFGSPNGTPRKRRKQCQNFIQKLREMDSKKSDLVRRQILSDNKFISPAALTKQEQKPAIPQRQKVVAKRTQEATKQTPTKTPTKKATVLPADISLLVSPIKAPATTPSKPTKATIMGRINGFNLEGCKQIAVDISRPENHFPLKVFPFTNAPVNEGKHMVSGVDIKYKAHIADVSNDRCKAWVGGKHNNLVKVELPLLDHTELHEYEAIVKMMKKLGVHNEVIQDQEETAMMEILENEERQQHSFFMDFGTELVTEVMIADGTTGNVVNEEVDYFVVPLETTHTLGTKVFRSHVVDVTWRIGFATTLRKKTKSTKKKGKGSAKVADLISGLSNMNI